MKIYLVGGAVRDRLLGRPVHEKDYVVVGATVDEMLTLGYQPVGKDFPVFLHPETHDEYALARTERKTGRGYTQFAFHADPTVTLEDDLHRRDLTINAIAQDLETGKLIDPYGGQQDLRKKILRHVSPAFSEDPVRILRIARFLARYANLGFSIARETYILMRQMVRDGEVDALVPERVWQEFLLALMEPEPQQFFRVLRNCGALAILFPEIDQLFGIPDDPTLHSEIDCGEHALLALTRAAKLNYAGHIRFAALLQNIGKNFTLYTNWPNHSPSEHDAVKLIQQMCSHYRVPSNFKELAIMGIRFHKVVYNALHSNPDELLNLLEKTDAFRRPERFEEFLQACEVNDCITFNKGNKFSKQREYLINILKAANQVATADLIALGLKNAELGKALHEQRLIAISKSMSKYN